MCIVSEEENPLPVIRDAAYRKHVGGDQATETGNMHKNGKDRTCGFRDILADRQTCRQTYSLQYFSTAPASEGMKVTR